MKKWIVSLIALLLVLASGVCQAASYTLPEKMYNQLAIGSGLKGTFTVTAEGKAFDSLFLKEITDADFSLRGISSGNDLHYYVFQQENEEQQTGLTELYRKDGVYYLRSDMVQGKILALPTAVQVLDSLFPSGGENPTSSSFVYKILTLPEDIRKEKWEPALTRYQNELEMWLADFTLQAESVKTDKGMTAIDFTYSIPMNQVNEKIVGLFSEFAGDTEVAQLLDTVMTAEEKSLYLNPDLLYYYTEALSSLNTERSVRISKRVSAMGEMLRFRLELPLEEQITGYKELDIEKIGELNIYTLKKTGETTVLTLPDTALFRKESFETSVWFTRYKYDQTAQDANGSVSVRIEIAKTHENTTDEEEKTHETDHYTIRICHDTAYLPEDADPSVIQEYQKTEAEIDLHYSSKYAQNSATTLELAADIRKGESSSLSVRAKLKTAAPWLFMPFEVLNPIDTGTTTQEVLLPYLTDWISNAHSIIRHKEADEETAAPAENAAAESGTPEQAETVHEDGETPSPEADAVPLSADEIPEE